MPSNLFLIKTVELTNFNIYIYSPIDQLDIDAEIEALTPKLNEYQYPKEIISELLVLYGVNLIEVTNKNNQIILVSSNVLPEDIAYE